MEKLSDNYKDYTREQLVEEYLETRLASLINFCGVDRRWMPKDVSKDPTYWKAKDNDLHAMHYEIAKSTTLTDMTVFGLRTSLIAPTCMSLTTNSKPL